MFRPLLQERGYRVVHVQSSDRVPPDLAASFEEAKYDARLVFNPEKPGETLGELRRLGVVAVFIGTESGVEVGDLLAEELGLPSNGTELSRERRDKFLMHRELERKKVATYKRTLTTTFREAQAWMTRRGIPFPVITKPRASAGTQYFRISKNPEELERHIRETLGRTDLFGSPIKEVLTEEYLAGREFAVNGVVDDGDVYFTDIWEYFKKLTRAGSLIYDRDKILAFESLEATILIPYVRSVLKALGFRYGTFHAEVKLVPGRGPLLLEVAARPMGSFQPRIVKLCTGTNQIELMIDALLDQSQFRVKTSHPYHLFRKAQVVELSTHKRGWVTSIPIASMLNPQVLPSYSSHKLGLQIGDWVEPTVDLLASHPGTVFQVHESSAQIDQDYLNIRTSEHDGGINVTRNPLFKCRFLLQRAAQGIGLGL